jgi:hypothetical protein
MNIRRILNKKILIGFVAIVLILFGLIYAAAEPNGFLRYAFFRTAYSVSVTRAWMLQQYSNFLNNHNGGYMGEPIDTFLCSRLESNTSDSERAAVLEFYSLRAGGREGDRISKISDSSKQRAIPLLLQKVDSYNARQALGALLVIEDMRRGETIYKGGFVLASNEWEKASFNFDRWWAESGLPETKAKYNRWWNMKLDWNQKKLIDPLSDSNVKVTYIP